MSCIIDYNNDDANRFMFRNEKYIETREPYTGMCIYPPRIIKGDDPDNPEPGNVEVLAYDPKTKNVLVTTLPRFIYNLKVKEITKLSETGSFKYKDGNNRNLDINNIDITREFESAKTPFDGLLVNVKASTMISRDGKEEMFLYSSDTKRVVRRITCERYWLSVKLGRDITPFDGRVIHKDGNIMNNNMDNLELKPSNCTMGEGIYSDCKIEKTFNKPRGRWMVTIYRRNPDTGFWDRIEGKAYARYLMEVKLGKILPKDVEVDHINGDRSDDRIDNLQLVSPEENKFKATYTGENRVSTADEIEYRCRNCGKTVRMRLWKFDINSPSNSSFCGRDCKFEYMRKRGLTSEETLGVSPDIMRYIKVPTISKEIMERTSDEIKQRVMSTCEAAKEYTVGYGMGFYVVPTLIPTNQFFALSMNPLLVQKVTSDPELKKEYVFNSIPITPFDI